MNLCLKSARKNLVKYMCTTSPKWTLCILHVVIKNENMNWGIKLPIQMVESAFRQVNG